ncbi:MAG TPA: YkgJ family cysteine cluster protein [Candidatus Hydrogenedentes bacterium]|nr:YkgJ family cysteine cluster protein [Candidatus Hydrogenedentota bacterium]
MGKHVVRFKCHHCGHCCKDVVCLPTPGDVVRIVRATGLDPHMFLEFITGDEVDEVPKNDPAWLKVNGKRYLMALRRGRTGCFFREPRTKNCRIYKARPLLCQLYPCRLHQSRDGAYKRFSLHNDVGCPRHRDGEIKADPLYKLYQEDLTHQRDYHDLVTYFNRQKSPDKTPEDFIKTFITIVRSPHREKDRVVVKNSIP